MKDVSAGTACFFLYLGSPHRISPKAYVNSVGFLPLSHTCLENFLYD